MHSSYTPPGTVVDEPVVTSEAIANSQRKGYWVSPLFRDDRLVELWLRHAAGARAAAVEGAVERIAAHLTPAAAGTRVTLCRARAGARSGRVALVRERSRAGDRVGGLRDGRGLERRRHPRAARPTRDAAHHRPSPPAPEHGPTTSMSPAITIDERRYNRQIAAAFETIRAQHQDLGYPAMLQRLGVARPPDASPSFDPTKVA